MPTTVRIKTRVNAAKAAFSNMLSNNKLLCAYLFFAFCAFVVHVVMGIVAMHDLFDDSISRVDGDGSKINLQVLLMCAVCFHLAPLLILLAGRIHTGARFSKTSFQKVYSEQFGLHLVLTVMTSLATWYTSKVINNNTQTYINLAYEYQSNPAALLVDHPNEIPQILTAGVNIRIMAVIALSTLPAALRLAVFLTDSVLHRQVLVKDYATVSAEDAVPKQVATASGAVPQYQHTQQQQQQFQQQGSQNHWNT
jgi:hypothetical protein